MAQHTIPIVVNSASSLQANKWTNINTLVQAALAAANKGPISPFGQTVTVRNCRGNASGTIVQITSDPANTLAAFELLVEESESFTDNFRQCSIMDKWIKATDSSGTALDGINVVVTVDQA